MRRGFIRSSMRSHGNGCKGVPVFGHALDLRYLRSFLVVAETGSVTQAAAQLGRTQPAITMQLQKLEELVGKQLFTPESRRTQLTEDGEVVLHYAKSLLRMQDEMMLRLSTAPIQGHVILGTPDLYAAYLLPPVLARFRQAFPGIQVELRCSLSTPLLSLVRQGEVDIALITRMRGFTGGQVVHQEQLIWVASKRYDAHLKDPVPLAVLPPGNIFREHAIDALERSGRRWRVICTSESMGGLQAAVFAGMAVAVVAQSALVPGMRQIGPEEYFPALPKVDLLLYRAPSKSDDATKTLADYLGHFLRFGRDAMPASGQPGASPDKGEDAWHEPLAEVAGGRR